MSVSVTCILVLCFSMHFSKYFLVFIIETMPKTLPTNWRIALKQHASGWFCDSQLCLRNASIKGVSRVGSQGASVCVEAWGVGQAMGVFGGVQISKLKGFKALIVGVWVGSEWGEGNF